MHKKIALIIGGSGGIGRAIVHRFLKDDMQVVATYRSDEKLVELQGEFQGKDVAWVKLDFLDEPTLAFEEIRKKLPLIDVVVFGPTLPTPHTPVLEVVWQDLEMHLRVQLYGMHMMVAHLKKQLQEKYPTRFIVILTEYCFGKPPSGLAPYVTAKYALMGFAKTMAVELGRYGCTVSMVSPGMVQTELLSSVPLKLVEINVTQNPLKRIATPGDVSNVVAFLASDQSNYLNGAHITVNGGSVMI
ncbi:MAG: SDR family oxidoreductase [bacterium]|nr:SDR family oxidoreductase [bacterium]